jgi:flagellar basal-body rod protein FlgC
MKKPFGVLLLLFLIQPVFAKQGGLDNAMDIAVSGMIVNRSLIQLSAQNIANVDTTRTPGGKGPYARKIAVLRSRGVTNKGGVPDVSGLHGVELAEVRDDHGNFSKVYDPRHPDATADGFVMYPNVDLASELVKMGSIQSAFETNSIVFNNTKQMMQTMLEIGR